MRFTMLCHLVHARLSTVGDEALAELVGQLLDLHSAIHELNPVEPRLQESANQWGELTVKFLQTNRHFAKEMEGRGWGWGWPE